MNPAGALGLILTVALAGPPSVGTQAAGGTAQDKPAKGSPPVPRVTGAAAAEKALRERVTAYWQTRKTLNLQQCHPFYEPAFRAKHTPDSFAREFRRLNRFAPEFLGIESVVLDPLGKGARVKVKLRTRPDVLGGEEFIAVVEESWLLEDGTWWKAAESLLPEF